MQELDLFEPIIRQKELAVAESLRGGVITKLGINILDHTPIKGEEQKTDKKDAGKSVKKNLIGAGKTMETGASVQLNEEDDEEERELENYRKMMERQDAQRRQELNDLKIFESEKEKLEYEIQDLMKLKEKEREKEKEKTDSQQTNTKQKFWNRK